MVILGVLGFALAAFSAVTFAVMFRTLWRTQGIDEPDRLQATTGLVMVGWLLSAAVGMALITFALTSRISS
jgi:hypothetical protein